VAKCKGIGWVNDMTGSPRIEGNLEISKNRDGIFIGGDPDAFRSLAGLLIWMASVDQESLAGQPDGTRFHVHLHTRDAVGFNSLTPFSCETELRRLDAKGTGEFPEKYCKLIKRNTKKEKGVEKVVKLKKSKRSVGKVKGKS
jgi:hypothetical protein